MIDVRGDDGPAAGDFGADEFGCDGLRETGAERLPGVLAQQPGVARVAAQFIQAQVLADGAVFHLGGDDPGTGIVHLGDSAARSGPTRGAQVLEAQVGEGGIGLAAAPEFGTGRRELFGVAAFHDPVGPQIRQADQEVDRHPLFSVRRVGVGSGGVVDEDRRVLLDPLAAGGGGLGHLAHGHPNVGPRPLHVDLAGVGKGLGDRVRKPGGLLDEFVRDGTHGCPRGANGRALVLVPILLYNCNGQVLTAMSIPDRPLRVRSA